MNCGPATVTGAKKKRYAPAGVSLARRQSSFPDMFVANLASVNDCKTPESFDYNYPNPGQEVQSAGTGPYTNLACGAGGNNPAPQPTGAASGSGPGSGTQPSSAPATAPTGGAGGNPGSAQPSGGAGGQPQQPPTGSQPQQPEQPQQPPSGGQGGTRTGAPGSFATGANPLPPDVGSAPSGDVPAASAPAAPPASTGTASAPPASSGGSISGAQPQGSACTDEGAWLCLPGGQSFQRCASGVWSVTQSMAAGMQCTPGGASANFQMSRLGGVPKYKREPRRIVV